MLKPMLLGLWLAAAWVAPASAETANQRTAGLSSGTENFASISCANRRKNLCVCSTSARGGVSPWRTLCRVT